MPLTPSGQSDPIPPDKPPGGSSDPIPPDKPPGGVVAMITSSTGLTDTVEIKCHQWQDPDELFKQITSAVFDIAAEWKKH